MSENETLVLEGKIEIPYRWSTGGAAGLFLTGLRDERVFLATRCAACDRTQVPPQNFCGRCYADLDDWVEVGPGGVLAGWVEVRQERLFPPAPVPYVVGRIRLDGADGELIHLVRPSGSEPLEEGSRLRPVFREAPEGTILDLVCFEPEVVS